MNTSFALPLALAVLPLVGCGGSPSDGGTTVSGTLLLQAFGGPSGQVSAQVGLEGGVGPQETCGHPLKAGACQFTSCQLGGIADPVPGVGNLGSISASVGSTTVAVAYNGFGYGTVDFPSSIALGSGGTMTFQGADGPREFNVTATIPGLAVLTNPDTSKNGGDAIIDASEDLTVTWVPISIGQIEFELDGPLSSSNVATSLTCTFEGSSGSGVVSRTLLSSMKEMSGKHSVSGHVSSQLVATSVLDNLTIVAQSFQQDTTTERGFSVTLQ